MWSPFLFIMRRCVVYLASLIYYVITLVLFMVPLQGWIQDFKLGGADLKKLRSGLCILDCPFGFLERLFTGVLLFIFNKPCCYFPIWSLQLSVFLIIYMKTINGG
jgi:hypothetical protein